MTRHAVAGVIAWSLVVALCIFVWLCTISQVVEWLT